MCVLVSVYVHMSGGQNRSTGPPRLELDGTEEPKARGTKLFG